MDDIKKFNVLKIMLQRKPFRIYLKNDKRHIFSHLNKYNNYAFKGFNKRGSICIRCDTRFYFMPLHYQDIDFEKTFKNRRNKIHKKEERHWEEIILGGLIHGYKNKI